MYKLLSNDFIESLIPIQGIKMIQPTVLISNIDFKKADLFDFAEVCIAAGLIEAEFAEIIKGTLNRVSSDVLKGADGQFYFISSLFGDMQIYRYNAHYQQLITEKIQLEELQETLPLAGVFFFEAPQTEIYSEDEHQEVPKAIRYGLDVKNLHCALNILHQHIGINSVNIETFDINVSSEYDSSISDDKIYIGRFGQAELRFVSNKVNFETETTPLYEPTGYSSYTDALNFKYLDSELSSLFN